MNRMMNVGTDNHVTTFARCKYFWLVDESQRVLEGNRIVGRMGEALTAIISSIHGTSFHDISTVTYFLNFNA
jgi:hypothetical protein